MKTYNIKLTLKAANEVQLTEKLQAFQDLQDHLQHEDLVTSVEVIVAHPEIVEFIKEVIPKDGKELSMTDYIIIAKKAFERFGD